MLLEHGADANMADDNGNTALHLAALIPSTSIANSMLQHEADINAQNKVKYPMFTTKTAPISFLCRGRSFSLSWPRFMSASLIGRLSLLHNVERFLPSQCQSKNKFLLISLYIIRMVPRVIHL